MERIMTPEERIRRAEEIYYRRQSQGVRVSTASVNISNNKISLGKKMLIQIAVCIVIYGVFWGLKNRETVFSQNIINKTKDILNYDINFQNLYGQCMEYFNKNFNNIIPVIQNNNDKQNQEDNSQNINEDDKDNDENVDNNLNNENIENNQNNNEFNQNNETIQDINQDNTEDIQNIENNIQENQSNSLENQPQNTENLGIGGGLDSIESDIQNKSQMELDADFIKQNYSLINPIQGVVTSRFGNREPTEIISAFHQGIDIGAVTGTSIHASMEGTVIASSYAGDYGNHIKIQNGDVLTVYAHCSELCVSVGDYITQGQEIAKVGSTGKVTGPHLHFEIRRENRYVNPDLILNF